MIGNLQLAHVCMEFLDFEVCMFLFVQQHGAEILYIHAYIFVTYNLSQLTAECCYICDCWDLLRVRLQKARMRELLESLQY